MTTLRQQSPIIRLAVIDAALRALDWNQLGHQLDQEGYALISGLLRRQAACDADGPLPSLPGLLGDVAGALYPYLVPVANRWLGMDDSANGLCISRVILSRLHAGEREALHQTPLEENGFPLEAAVLLSRPGADFTGGEFVMTEQRPRMQSRPIVVPLCCGDLVLFAAGRRPFRGSQGFYPVNMRHAVSRVRSGERLGAVLHFCGFNTAEKDDHGAA